MSSDTPATALDAPVIPQRHALIEDAMAILLGTALVALGIGFYAKAMLLTSSTAGLSLLLHYLTGYSFGVMFFALNLPFWWLAVKRMGWAFAGRTFAAVSLLAVFTRLTPQWIDISGINGLYAAILGGGLAGMGMLALFRHRTGLGGINILALYLQENFGFRAGYFQLGVDALILIAALFILPADRILLSMVGAAVLNVIVGVNHKPGRYLGVS
ncbi:YitT family protein [Terrarubrum flagellatum]|uniref:YitT family protein n=1 Tax=Terrirubrum flagellatum TaxID=2895980 RepID=UPI0031452988